MRITLDQISRIANEERMQRSNSIAENFSTENLNISRMEKERSRLLRKLLRELRARRDESLADMAGRLGISVSLLSSIENGQRFPPADFMERIIEAYRLRGREKENLIVAETIASDAPIEFELGNRKYDERYVRVALFLANALAEAGVEALQEACMAIENAIAQRKTDAAAPRVSDRKYLPIYLEDGWSPPEDDFEEDDMNQQTLVPIRLRTDSKERRLRRNRSSRYERISEEETHDDDN